jgi:nicotinamidase-related amidase
MTEKAMNVLVVIDVQNCFMFHQDGTEADKGGTFLNVSEETTSKAIVDELESLVEDKTHVVFSRDFHPVNHISLEGYEGRTFDPANGVWPKHCRNKNLQCKSREKSSETVSTTDPVIPNKIVDTTTGEIVTNKQVDNDHYVEVVGTELSYMFYTSVIFREPVKQLVLGNRKGENKIGLDDTTVESRGKLEDINKSDEERKINYGEPLTVDNRQYIALTKGERCDKEAYSAFNYHIEYDSSQPSKPTYSKITPDDAANSTGLWEWILNNKTSNEITITVCGLVGNVCVMHSLLQGIALWNNVYSKLPENEGVKVKFVYSLRGTRFAVVPPFKDVKPDFDTDKVVDHFNDEKSLPEGMGTIRMTTGVVTPSERVTSFEVLNYDGTVKTEKGDFAESEDDFVHNIYRANMNAGRRHRRSVRRRRGNKSRKTTKRVKGRRTYKNKRRNTKRRL